MRLVSVGVDSFVVEGNHFNEVIVTAAITTLIEDGENNGTADYVSTKAFTQNDGTHVGLMAIATILDADVSAWNIQETDIIRAIASLAILTRGCWTLWES